MHERHGLWQLPEYNSWRGAKKRCFLPTDKDYPRYGARGITMCPEWADSFVAFLADMGRKPGPEYTLERIDVNGHYCRDNCVWVTVPEQNRNRRSCIYVEFGCQKMTLKDACRAASVSYSATRHWMQRHGTTFYQTIARK